MGAKIYQWPKKADMRKQDETRYLLEKITRLHAENDWLRGQLFDAEMSAASHKANAWATAFTAVICCMTLLGLLWLAKTHGC